MKNLIKRNFNKTSAPEMTIDETIIQRCTAQALSYAGVGSWSVTVDSARLEDDGTGSYCVVTFRDASQLTTRCEMCWTAYVDVLTGEVVGFSGDGEKSWLDCPHDAVPAVSADSEEFAA